MNTFTVYRRKNIDATHPTGTVNDSALPQFEGVIFEDHSVAIRWTTSFKSTSVWSSLYDLLQVHGHPEYHTEIEFHGGSPNTYRGWYTTEYKYSSGKKEVVLNPQYGVKCREKRGTWNTEFHSSFHVSNMVLLDPALDIDWFVDYIKETMVRNLYGVVQNRIAELRK
jgi:hypothetical protein